MEISVYQIYYSYYSAAFVTRTAATTPTKTPQISAHSEHHLLFAHLCAPYLHVTEQHHVRSLKQDEEDGNRRAMWALRSGDFHSSSLTIGEEDSMSTVGWAVTADALSGVTPQRTRLESNRSPYDWPPKKPAHHHDEGGKKVQRIGWPSGCYCVPRWPLGILQLFLCNSNNNSDKKRRKKSSFCDAEKKISTSCVSWFWFFDSLFCVFWTFES